MASTIAPEILSATTAGLLSTSDRNRSLCELKQQVIERPLYEYLYMYVLAAFIAIGVPCNALAFFVLLSDRTTSTTRVLLLANTASDNFILLSGLPFLLRDIYHLTNWWPLQVFGFGVPYFYALGSIGKFIQVWLNVALSADRFFCVRFPLSVSRRCTPRRAFIMAFAIMLLSLVLNGPRFFIYKSVLLVDACSGWKYFYFDQLYVLPVWFQEVFVEAFDAIVNFAVPLLLLLYLNAALIRSLHAASQRRYQMMQRNRAARHNCHNHHNFERDYMITLMLVIVVCTFIVFETPSALLTVLELVFKAMGMQELWDSSTRITWFLCGLVANLLLLLNSFTDPLLYVLVNRNFRKNLRELTCFSRTNGVAAPQNVPVLLECR